MGALFVTILFLSSIDARPIETVKDLRIIISTENYEDYQTEVAVLDAEEGNHLEDTLVDTSAFRQVQGVDNQTHWVGLVSWDY